MITRRFALLAGAAATALAAAGPVLAGGVGVTLNADESGLMLKGYDPVAYFTEDAAVKGSDAFSAQHEGVTYHFASAGNRDAFLAEPAKYAPAFGGYCAMGTAMGLKLDTDPELFRVVEGTLYLNVAKPAQDRWLEDVPGNIAKANAKWQEIQDIPASELQP